MSFTINITAGAIKQNSRISTNQEFTCTVSGELDEAVPDAASDVEKLFAIDVSALKCFMMVADVAMTVKTNDSGSPQETFSLTAGKPVLWREGDTAIFAGDVTALYVSNASGTAGTLEVLFGGDP